MKSEPSIQHTQIAFLDPSLISKLKKKKTGKKTISLAVHIFKITETSPPPPHEQQEHSERARCASLMSYLL